MVSEFRKTKLAYMFKTFFDTDKSGSITKKDFDDAVQKVAKNKGYNPDNPILKQVKEALEKIWNLLQTSADTNNDGEVTQDEWIAMWENYTKNSSASDEWQNLYSKTIFSVVDSGNDGVIDEDEYAKHYAIYGLSKEDAAKSFRKAAGGKKTINYEEYRELWTQYFLSEDPKAPGNFIFGTL